MQTRQINIFGNDDIIESLVESRQFSQQAQDHIRLLRNLTLETAVLDFSTLSKDEREYIQYLRERMAAALAKSLQN